MKNKFNPILAGAFVIGGFALMICGLLLFQPSRLFSTPGRFIAYFNESVQGLDVGGAVKLHGVRVGRVVEIRVFYDSRLQKSVVAVVGEMDSKGILDHKGLAINVSDRSILQRLIDDGLRAKIDLTGITGVQFVELDFLNIPAIASTNLTDSRDYPVVPTVPSGMAEFIANLSKIASNLNKVDFAGISTELKSLLGTANLKAGDLDLKRMVNQVTTAAQSIESVAGSEEAKALFSNLNKTALDLQQLTAKLDSQVEPVSAEWVRTLRSFQDTAESLRKLMGPQSALNEKVGETLRQITEAAESLQQLADFIERNPEALIMGKKRPDSER